MHWLMPLIQLEACICSKPFYTAKNIRLLDLAFSWYKRDTHFVKNWQTYDKCNFLLSNIVIPTLTYQIFNYLKHMVHGPMSHGFQLHSLKFSDFTSSIFTTSSSSMQNKSQTHEKALWNGLLLWIVGSVQSICFLRIVINVLFFKKVVLSSFLKIDSRVFIVGRILNSGRNLNLIECC